MEFKGWVNCSETASRSFQCWCCNEKVASDKGYTRRNSSKKVIICPHCASPNYFNSNGTQIPAPSIGDHIENVPEQVSHTYDEARNAFSANAFTASALMCRKILMNVSVTEGAATNKSFKFYVDWLYDNHFISPKSKDWVDLIREKGNAATHEIPSITQEDAKQLITFCEMILKTIYEFPAITGIGDTK